MKKIIILFLCFSYFNFFAQTPNDDFIKFKTKYKDFHSVVTLLHTSYNMKIVDGKPNVSSHQTEETMVLQDLGKMRNRESIHYSDFRDVQNLNAYTLIPENNTFKKIPVEKFDRKSFISERNFHDDNKQIEFYYPNLEIGAKKTMSYDIHYNDVNMLNSFALYNGNPIEEAVLEIVADKNIEVGYKIFNSNGHHIEFITENKGDKNILKWTAKNLLPFKNEEDMVSALTVIPHIEIYVKNYTQNGKKINVLNDLDDLYKLYQFYLKNVNKTEDADLRAEVNRITKDISGEEDKVKAIYYWVKDHIKYISFEEGYDGFVPRNAKDIYKRKYGDCKDMTSILYQMIKIAGINNVYYTWVGSRTKPYSYYDVPTMIVDDHMIAVYKNSKNEYQYLDATSSNTTYGMPSHFIQGKECLIGNENSYEVVKIPVQKGESNLISENISLKVNKNSIEGNSVSKYYGYNRDAALEKIADKEGNKKLEAARALLQKGSNKFNLLNFEMKNKENRDVPLEIDYQFKIDSYTLDLDGEIFVNLFLDKPLENTIIDKDRMYGIEKDFAFKKDYTLNLEIPKGYKANYIPKNDTLSNDLLEYVISYKQDNNSIILNYTIKTKKLIIKPEDFALYNASIKKLKENFGESVSISKI